jgi:nicotinate phosphoribosyltransferase
LRFAADAVLLMSNPARAGAAFDRPPMKFDLRFTEAPFTAFCDWYQLTQLQALMHQMSHAGGIRIRMNYTVRSRGANTARLRAVLREALDRFEDRHVILAEELPFLREVRYIKPLFADNLRDLRLHPRDFVEITERGGELAIAIEGGIQAMLFEQLILAIVSELWSQLTFPEPSEMLAASRRAVKLLESELEKIRRNAEADPEKPIRLTEAGTRRRFSLQHQREVLLRMREEIPQQLFGTSNIRFAKEMDLRLVGTQAHLFGMIFQQHGGTLATFPTRAMQAWVSEYRGDLGYMLPDVLTTRAWLQQVDLYFAKLFDGFRHDSGDPHAWTKLIIDHLTSLGIDPASKFAVYSDTLTIDAMRELWRRYEGNPWKTSYLIGTFLTNNVPGHKALSQVIKLSAVNGQPVAKISDEPQKASCDDREFLATLKKTFGIV